jgi:hypothetical protein
LGSKAIPRLLLEEFGQLSERLSRLPRCFTHRDYHSKNLMLEPNGDLAVIDFQDAILAPSHYDLASLLWDCYVDLDANLKETIIDEYWQSVDRQLTGTSRNAFAVALREVALHRNLKAAGRFVYIWLEKKRASHLPFVIPALTRVKEHLQFLGDRTQACNQIPFAAIENAVRRQLNA